MFLRKRSGSGGTRYRRIKPPIRGVVGATAARWIVTIQFMCPACGGTSITAAEGCTDDAQITCGGCGARSTDLCIGSARETAADLAAPVSVHATPFHFSSSFSGGFKTSVWVSRIAVLTLLESTAN